MCSVVLQRESQILQLLQRKLIVWIKIRRLNNVMLQTLSGLNYYAILATCSKYNIDASHMSENTVKQTLWMCSLTL